MSFQYEEGFLFNYLGSQKLVQFILIVIQLNIILTSKAGIIWFLHHANSFVENTHKKKMD